MYLDTGRSPTLRRPVSHGLGSLLRSMGREVFMVEDGSVSFHVLRPGLPSSLTLFGTFFS